MHSLSRRLVLVSLGIAAASAALRADVIVVDPAGGPGAALLQSALDTAKAGDILLLKAGHYTGPQLVADGKGLVVVAERGAEVVLTGLAVHNVPPGQTVVLRGLTILSGQQPLLPFEVRGQGYAWVEDCRSKPRDNGTPLAGVQGSFALTVASSAASVVVRCEAHGGNGSDATGPTTAWPGGLGVNLEPTFAGVVMECTATGGNGGDGPVPFGQYVSGAQGLHISFSDLLCVLGGIYVGGDDGADSGPGTEAGPGLSATIVGTLAVRDATFIPGQVIGEGIPGLPIAQLSFQFLEYDAPTRSLEVSSPVRELEHATFRVKGQPGDHAFAFVATSFAPVLVKGLQGMFLPGNGAPLVALPLGTITNSSGVLDGELPMPRLPTGLDGMVLYTQVGVLDAGGEPSLGSGSAVTWLSAAL